MVWRGHHCFFLAASDREGYLWYEVAEDGSLKAMASGGKVTAPACWRDIQAFMRPGGVSLVVADLGNSVLVGLGHMPTRRRRLGRPTWDTMLLLSPGRDPSDWQLRLASLFLLSDASGEEGDKVDGVYAPFTLALREPARSEAHGLQLDEAALLKALDRFPAGQPQTRRRLREGIFRDSSDARRVAYDTLLEEFDKPGRGPGPLLVVGRGAPPEDLSNVRWALTTHGDALVMDPTVGIVELQPVVKSPPWWQQLVGYISHLVRRKIGFLRRLIRRPSGE